MCCWVCEKRAREVCKICTDSEDGAVIELTQPGVLRTQARLKKRDADDLLKTQLECHGMAQAHTSKTTFPLSRPLGKPSGHFRSMVRQDPQLIPSFPLDVHGYQKPFGFLLRALHDNCKMWNRMCWM